jgi:signal transduction histidine kinase
MIEWLRPSRLPVAIRVPLLIAILMVVVAAGTSNAVLHRLDQSQQSHFHELKGVYLEGLATALRPYMIRRDPWEVFDVLDRARSGYSAPNAKLTLVVGTDGRVLASSDPRLFSIGSQPPGELASLPAIADLDDPDGEVWVKRDLHEAGVHLGAVAALIDVTSFQKTRSETLIALIGFNLLLTILLAAIGWFVVRRALQPLVRLSDLLARSVDGRLPAVPVSELPPPDTEAGRAYRSYNAAAAAIDEREALLKRLASEERASLIGRYASALAHEVNNPLGGLFNAVRMIQRHGDDQTQREKAAQLIERGLTGIRNVVKASLVLWRSPVQEAKVTPSDIEDLRFLVAGDAERRGLILTWENQIEAEVPVLVQPVRQIALNLLLNACAASARGSTIGFRAFENGKTFYLEVTDEGPGLPEEARQLLLSGPMIGVPASSGLGIWTVVRLVSELNGEIRLTSDKGSRIEVRLPHHAERALKPAA